MVQEKKRDGSISIGSVVSSIKLFVVVCLLCGLQKGFAQQETQYTQYMYNISSVNPGGLAIDDQLKIYASSRYQWVGVKGSPLTQFFSVESPINDRNTSLGVSIINDKIGPLTETELIANIAHYVPFFNNSRRLSFGLRVGGRFFNLDWSKGNFEFDDPAFRNNVSEFIMVAGAGLYYKGEHFFGGIGVRNLLPNKIQRGNLSNEMPHYNFMLGYNFELEDDLSIKPVLFSSIVDGGAVRIEGSTTFNYKEKYTGGLSYKYQSAIGFIFGLQITPTIHVGYSYDVSLAETANLGLSSHEILVRYSIPKKTFKRENRYY